MNRYKVLHAPAAERQLVNLFLYIRDYLGSEEAAKKHIIMFEEAADSLEYMPCRNPIARYPAFSSREIRLQPFGNYYLAYCVEEQKKEVYVLKVLYSKSDLSKVTF